MGRLTAFLSAALLILMGVAASAPGQLGDAARGPVALSERVPPPVDGALSVGPPVSRVRAAAQVGGGPGEHVGARVLERAALRDAPDGRIVTGIGPKTRFGGPQVVAVVARRGDWIGVLHQWLPNGKAGWIRASAVRLVRQPWAIEVDRSERLATVRRDGEVVDRFRVAVGRPSSPTPLGRFGITDRLTAGPGSPYGCCILALSGRQPNLPPGWPGGDRLAFHGTPGDRVGDATSSGCMRVREADLRKLMRDIPVGTRVTVRA
jgi:lipoprotein-anchoring transpeptidase ErfK/SrfK